jgi:hypothetical protein
LHIPQQISLTKPPRCHNVKILIASSPKTGNVWLENLLSHIYGLPVVDMSGTDHRLVPPERLSGAYVARQHYSCTPELLAWGAMENVQFITNLRHPADVFVSFYYYLNKFTPLLEVRG